MDILIDIRGTFQRLCHIFLSDNCVFPFIDISIWWTCVRDGDIDAQSQVGGGIPEILVSLSSCGGPIRYGLAAHPRLHVSRHRHRVGESSSISRAGWNAAILTAGMRQGVLSTDEALMAKVRMNAPLAILVSARERSDQAHGICPTTPVDDGKPCFDTGQLTEGEAPSAVSLYLTATRRAFLNLLKNRSRTDKPLDVAINLMGINRLVARQSPVSPKTLLNNAALPGETLCQRSRRLVIPEAVKTWPRPS